MKPLEETIEYHELLMVRTLNKIEQHLLPEGFSFVFWNNDNCIKDWVNIHIETGEFNSIEDAYSIFHKFYDKFYNDLSSRCLFITNKKGEKIATATISPSEEFSYKCVIDWFAISPKAQGLKLSKPLLSKVLNTAKQLGYKKILLHTQTSTWLAAKIYLDCGFRPYKTKNNKGWNILKTITNHPKLNNFKTLPQDEIYDPFLINVKKELDKKHKNYNFNVYYTNNRNCIFVKEGNKYFKYTYKSDGNNIYLTSVK